MDTKPDLTTVKNNCNQKLLNFIKELKSNGLTLYDYMNSNPGGLELFSDILVYRIASEIGIFEVHPGSVKEIVYDENEYNNTLSSLVLFDGYCGEHDINCFYFVFDMKMSNDEFEITLLDVQDTQSVKDLQAELFRKIIDPITAIGLKQLADMHYM